MDVVNTLPSEVLCKILSYLDRESLYISSQVCLRWKALLHDLSWQFLKSVTSDSQQLQTRGFIQEQHSFNDCRLNYRSQGVERKIIVVFQVY